MSEKVRGYLVSASIGLGTSVAANLIGVKWFEDLKQSDHQVWIGLVALVAVGFVIGWDYSRGKRLAQIAAAAPIAIPAPPIEPPSAEDFSAVLEHPVAYFAHRRFQAPLTLYTHRKFPNGTKVTRWSAEVWLEDENVDPLARHTVETANKELVNQGGTDLGDPIMETLLGSNTEVLQRKQFNGITVRATIHLTIQVPGQDLAHIKVETKPQVCDMTRRIDG